jgi:hypothetical protein
LKYWNKIIEHYGLKNPNETQKDKKLKKKFNELACFISTKKQMLEIDVKKGMTVDESKRALISMKEDELRKKIELFSLQHSPKEFNKILKKEIRILKMEKRKTSKLGIEQKIYVEKEHKENKKIVTFSDLARKTHSAKKSAF